MPPSAAADCAFDASVVVATEPLAAALVPAAAGVEAAGGLVLPPLPLLLQAASARLAATVATEIATQC